MTFEFATATCIVFGPGAIARTLPEVARLGRRALLVTGGRPERASPVRAALDDPMIVTVPGEPDIALAAQATERARAGGCDFVVSMGGGSAIDLGKAVAMLLANGGDALDYLEVVGRGQPVTRPSAPFVAIPTTAGTGAEVTRNAVLFSPEHGVKASLRSPHMLPALAIVDPEATLTLPPSVTASTGLDALTQVLEPFVSRRANPLTDALCREGLGRAGRSLRRVYLAPDDLDARTDMALASLLGGLALANAGLGAAHGFAGPLGGITGAAHGMLCAALLPHVMRANLRAAAAQAPATLARYAEIGAILTGTASAEAAVAWVEETCRALAVPGLAALGLRPEQHARAVAAAGRSSSMKGNPVALEDDELRDILVAAC